MEEKATVASAILDTNILQYLGSEKDLSAALFRYLEDLKQRKYELVVSDISSAELLSGIPKEKMEQAIHTLGTYRTLELTRMILYLSARLCHMYTEEKIPNTQINLADRIIAATVILSDSVLLTANFHDFPWPFFEQIEEKLIFYKHKNRMRMMPVCLLQPNLHVIDQRYSE